jgi:hypothetical protein
VVKSTAAASRRDRDTSAHGQIGAISYFFSRGVLETGRCVLNQGFRSALPAGKKRKSGVLVREVRPDGKAVVLPDTVHDYRVEIARRSFSQGRKARRISVAPPPGPSAFTCLRGNSCTPRASGASRQATLLRARAREEKGGLLDRLERSAIAGSSEWYATARFSSGRGGARLRLTK